MALHEALFEGVPYLVRYPQNYKDGEKYPVILLLHGAGSRGDSTDKLRTNPFFTLTEAHNDFPFVTVAPLCYKNTWFDLFETLERFAAEICHAPFADPTRIYLMGASMGGYATWQLAMSCPELFAAIAPVCGGGMYWNAARLVNVPVWAFHGARDKTVFLEESQKMVDAVNKRGGCARLTVYPAAPHDSWTPTYTNKEVFAWLLSHTNENAKALLDEYNNTKAFG